MFKRTKKYISKRFNIKQWVGYPQLKDQAGMIKELYTEVSPIKQRQQYKSKNQNLNFSELMQLQKMTDKDIEKRIKSEHRQFFYFLAFSILPLVYSVYILFQGLFLGGIVSFLAFVLVLGYAFRCKVTIYQLRNRRLSFNFKVILREFFKKA
jgi:hypothetical protein